MGTVRAGAKPATVSGYIEAAPKEARKMLRELRALLKKAAPKAKEAIKWRTPVLETTRILFAFGAFRTLINFMPAPSVMKALILKLAKRRVRELEEKDAKWM